jgi:hypothetical protein
LASTLKSSLGLGFTLWVLMVPAGHAIFRCIWGDMLNWCI